MKASKTSKAWMQEHLNDPYVKLAQKDGYRARAAYKLTEIDDKDKLIKHGMTIVDLGSTPVSYTHLFCIFKILHIHRTFVAACGK